MVRHQHQFLALAAVGDGDDGVATLGPDRAGDALHRRQGHHLAADLGEAFGAPLDGDIALGVHVHDVAGVQPVVADRIPGQRLGRGDIAAHDVRTLQEQAAAGLDPLDGLQLPVDARQHLAHGARRVAVRVVHGDDGRGLGRAVTLQQFDAAELGIEQGAGLLAHLLGPGDGELQGGEVVRFGDAGVLAQEGVGRKQDRGVHLGQQVGDLFGVERRRILERLQPLQQRQDDAAGQAETVECRQRVEHDPGRIKVDVGRDLSGIGDQVLLAQHHALGRAEAAGGEQDDARRVRVGPDAEPLGRSAGGQAIQLVGQADSLAHIVQPDDISDRFQLHDQVVQLGLVDEAFGGQHLLDARRLDSRLQIGFSGGEVQHDRHAAVGVQAKEGDDHAHRRRQQDGDPLAPFGHLRDLATQHEGGADQAGIGQGVTVLVFQDFLVAEPRARLDQGVDQGLFVQRRIQGLAQARLLWRAQRALSVVRASVINDAASS